MRAKKQVQTVLYVAVCKIEGRLGLLTFGYSLKGLSDRFQPEEDTGGFGRVDEAEEGPDHDLWLAEGDIVTICQIPTFAPGEYVDHITVHVCADCKAVFVPNNRMSEAVTPGEPGPSNCAQPVPVLARRKRMTPPHCIISSRPTRGGHLRDRRAFAEIRRPRPFGRRSVLETAWAHNPVRSSPPSSRSRLAT